jgi:hypothetical protein
VRNPPHVSGAVNQHPQAFMIASGEASQIEVVVVRHRTPVEQQPDDRGMRRPGDSAPQRRPAAIGGSPAGIRPGVEQKPCDSDQPIGPCLVKLIPPGRAGEVQGLPSRPFIGPEYQARVGLDCSPDFGDVAQHQRGGGVVVS